MYKPLMVFYTARSQTKKRSAESLAVYDIHIINLLQASEFKAQASGFTPQASGFTAHDCVMTGPGS